MSLPSVRRRYSWSGPTVHPVRPWNRWTGLCCCFLPVCLWWSRALSRRKVISWKVGLHYLGTGIGLRTLTLFSTATVLGSNLFSNVPLVIIVSHWVRQMSHPKFFWLLLALTSTFAGNLTLFGSVANVIVAQGAQQKAGLRFRDFLLAGIPVTLVTTTIGVLLLWLFDLLGFIG